MKIKNYQVVRMFEDLIYWNLAKEFRREIYKISETFHKEEKYYLTAQTRNAAILITTNLSEGFGRYHFQENIQFCRKYLVNPIGR